MARRCSGNPPNVSSPPLKPCTNTSNSVFLILFLFLLFVSACLCVYGPPDVGRDVPLRIIVLPTAESFPSLDLYGDDVVVTFSRNCEFYKKMHSQTGNPATTAEGVCRPSILTTRTPKYLMLYLCLQNFEFHGKEMWWLSKTRSTVKVGIHAHRLSLFLRCSPRS